MKALMLSSEDIMANKNSLKAHYTSECTGFDLKDVGEQSKFEHGQAGNGAIFDVFRPQKVIQIQC
jgi:hypothetical protein